MNCIVINLYLHMKVPIQNKGRTILFLGGWANLFLGKIVCFKCLTNNIVCFSIPMEKIASQLSVLDCVKNTDQVK